MRLFGGLFKSNQLSEEFVDEVIPELEIKRFSFRPVGSVLRVVKLVDPISGEEFEVDLNDKVSFRQLMCNSALDGYI